MVGNAASEIACQSLLPMEIFAAQMAMMEFMKKEDYRSPTKIPNRDKKTEPIDIVTRKPNLVHPLTYSHFY